MKIRLEEEKDYFEVENLVRDAFWNVYRPGAYEHFIVHNLRGDESYIASLAYVIESDGKIMAAISYSWGKIQYRNESVSAVMLGPVAVGNDCQNQGFGSKLIEHTLKLAENDDIPFVLVVGDEDYYSRFGFESASKYGMFLENTDMGEENPFFMIKIFDESKIRPESGIFHIPEVFDVDEDEVDMFDRRFEYKEKLIKEGQLGV